MAIIGFDIGPGCCKYHKSSLGCKSMHQFWYYFPFPSTASHQGQSLNIQHSDTTSRQKVHVMCRVRIKRGDVTCFLLFATQASLSSQTENHALQLILTHSYAVQSKVLSNVMHFCIFTQATIVRGENLTQCSSILGIGI